jgi:hypothetical protein
VLNRLGQPDKSGMVEGWNDGLIRSKSWRSLLGKIAARKKFLTAEQGNHIHSS